MMSALDCGRGGCVRAIDGGGAEGREEVAEVCE